jgi:allophanate hydrolase subunit 1
MKKILSLILLLAFAVFLTFPVAKASAYTRKIAEDTQINVAVDDPTVGTEVNNDNEAAVEAEQSNPEETVEASTTTNYLVYVGIGVLAAAVVAGGLFYFFKKGNLRRG